VVVKSDPPIKLWIARDCAGTGLYTLWVDGPPELNSDGYYKSGETAQSFGTLLMTIHSVKWPWNSLTLERGECKATVILPIIGASDVTVE